MTQIWCLLAGSVGREVIKGRMGSSKEQQPVPALLSERERAAFPQLVPWCWTVQFFLVCPWCLLSCCPHIGLRGSESECGSFKKKCLGLQKLLSSSASISAGFYSQKLWELLFLALEPWAGGPGCGAGTPLLRQELCSCDIPPDFYQPQVGVGPAYWESLLLLSFFKSILLIYFLERGERREKKRERNINVRRDTSIAFLLPAPNRGPGLHPKWESTQWCFSCRPALSPLSHTHQGPPITLDVAFSLSP